MRDVLDYLLGVYPAVLVLAFLAWLALPRRSPRLARWPLVAIWLGLLVFGAPPVATGLAALLAAGAPPPDPRDPPHLIVVPTGGVYSLADGTAFPSRSTVERTMAGLAAQRQWPVPVLLTGGNPEAGPPESEATVDALGLVVDDALMIETASADTCDSGVAAAEAAARLGATRVLLVTSGMHLTRAAACLRHNGLQVAALAADTAYDPTGLWAFLPSHRSLAVSMDAIGEMIGIGFYIVSGRIDFADL